MLEEPPGDSVDLLACGGHVVYQEDALSFYEIGTVDGHDVVDS